MRRVRVSRLLLCLLLTAPLAAAEVEHVVVVSLDGLGPTYYLEPQRHGLKIPNLRRLLAEGAAAEGMRSVFPTLTYPAHTSMVTGVPPRRHGIFLNSTPDPEMDFGLRWYVEDVRVPTLYQVAEEKGLRTALVFWPVTLGAQVDALFPEFWRGDRDDQKLLRAISTPGLVRGVEERFPGFRYDSPPEVRDQDLTDVAVYLVDTLRPQLLLLHLIGVDHAQHEYGLGSPEVRAAVETADTQLGRLLAALEEAGLWERSVFFVVSDHGFVPVEKVIHPTVILEQAGLLTVDEGGRLRNWEAAPVCGGGTCEILLRNPTDLITQEKVLGVFSSLAQEEGSGIARVIPPQETARLTADRGAFILLEAAPGFYFSSSHSEQAVELATAKATHGYHPDRPEQRAAFVMAGAGVKPARVPEVSILDLAPTIAHLLGFEFPSAEGCPLLELLEAGEGVPAGGPP